MSQIRSKATVRALWQEKADPPEYMSRMPAVPLSSGNPPPTMPSLYTGTCPIDKHSPAVVEWCPNLLPTTLKATEGMSGVRRLTQYALVALLGSRRHGAAPAYHSPPSPDTFRRQAPVAPTLLRSGKKLQLLVSFFAGKNGSEQSPMGSTRLKAPCASNNKQICRILRHSLCFLRV